MFTISLNPQAEKLNVRANQNHDRFNEKVDQVIRFFSISDRNIESLKDCTLYASLPEKFNDIWDCLHTNIQVYPHDKSALVDWLKSMNFDDTETDELLSGLEELPKKERIRNSLYSWWNCRHGIVCSSAYKLKEKSYSPGQFDLMWAHYTNNEGYALVLDVDELSESIGSPVPVAYLDDSHFEKYFNDVLPKSQLIERLYFQSFVKKSVWSYEKEIRFLLWPPNSSGIFETKGRFSLDGNEAVKYPRTVKYGPDCVRKIILGFSFFENSIDNVERQEVSFKIHEGVNCNSELQKKVLIDHVLSVNIPLELVILHKTTYKLINNPLKIKKINENRYKLDLIFGAV